MFSLQLRSDGASSAQPTKRWFYSPVASAQWNIAKDMASSSISALTLRASAGRIGRMQSFDQFSQGPQYTAQIGYSGNVNSPGYNGFSVLTRPYSAGWIGYDLPWAYSDQLNLGLDFGFNKRVTASLDFYTRNDKNQMFGIPSLLEFGYSQEHKSGMSINNTGIDLTLTASILPETQPFSWTSSVNVNYNTNKLKDLPGGLSQQQIGNRLLKVGESVDQYWLLQNEGIYTSDESVPGFGTDRVLSYSTGNPFRGGDPKWKDVNGDFIINDDDRVLEGHYLPVAAGGFDNRFKLKNWDLNINLYYNIGRDLINQEMSKRFDFINQESGRDINSVKEITFWEKRGDYNKYPLYNPWSLVLPYQSEQNLFLEDASFLKLRAVSVGYDLGQLLKKKNKTKVSRLYVYGTANNLFTLTSYSGRDPELVGFTGFDSGYSLPIPRTYTVGVKMDL
jgi:hypothetical protein